LEYVLLGIKQEARRQTMNDISILGTNVNSYTKQQHKQGRSANFSDIFNQKTKEKISEPNL
jgi:hypothetical protein